MNCSFCCRGAGLFASHPNGQCDYLPISARSTTHYQGAGLDALNYCLYKEARFFWVATAVRHHRSRPEGPARTSRSRPR